MHAIKLPFTFEASVILEEISQLAQKRCYNNVNPSEYRFLIIGYTGRVRTREVVVKLN